MESFNALNWYEFSKTNMRLSERLCKDLGLQSFYPDINMNRLKNVEGKG